MARSPRDFGEAQAFGEDEDELKEDVEPVGEDLQLVVFRGRGVGIFEAVLGEVHGVHFDSWGLIEPEIRSDSTVLFDEEIAKQAREFRAVSSTLFAMEKIFGFGISGGVLLGGTLGLW